LGYQFTGLSQLADKDLNIEAMTENDILIVAPYNAQVAALSEAMPTLSRRIGTVDRFQGQEAAGSDLLYDILQS
jgi:uncharacterized protein